MGKKVGNWKKSEDMAVLEMLHGRMKQVSIAK
jgi:hypothetical protein